MLLLLLVPLLVFGYGYSNAFQSRKMEIDPLSYDFFKQNEFNSRLYQRLNNYLAPEHNPVGFSNSPFVRNRNMVGGPPMQGKGLFSFSNSGSSSQMAVTINSLIWAPFDLLAYLCTLGGNLPINLGPLNSYKPKKLNKKRKIYIILGTSPNVGIHREKSRDQWLVEKISMANKKMYAEKHGIELIFLNNDNLLSGPNAPLPSDAGKSKLSTHDSFASHQKRYQHEFREGWEHFDMVRHAMKAHAVDSLNENSNSNSNDESKNQMDEWYWYLDIHTMIMEPEKSIDNLLSLLLDSQVIPFSHYEPDPRLAAEWYGVDDSDASWLSMATKRGFPLAPDSFLDDGNLLTKLANKNKKTKVNTKTKIDTNNIDLILTNDCHGINLSSFLIRRSKHMDMLLDAMWEPVFYRQMHQEWNKLPKKNSLGFRLDSGDNHHQHGLGNANKYIEEKNCLEYFLQNQGWLRGRTVILPTRIFNSLSDDICASAHDESSLSLYDRVNSKIVNDNNINDDDDDERLIEILESLDLEDQQIDNLLSQDGDINIDKLLSQLAKASKKSVGFTNLHYNATEQDFVVNFAACDGGYCMDRMRSIMGVYRQIHGKEIYDI
ncbi:hypothetical protein DAMA08_043870 [Martiniozyma asiatica (nom. inval.)]|nr:hypothetical protein DAMA08_043870 [Martiniozyma asiatica]